MTVIDSLFTSEFKDDGSSSSMMLSNYASHFITDIESRFGPRNRSFTLVGIVIDKNPNNPPQLWFPSSGIELGHAELAYRHIVIRLNPLALCSPERARWQLAHECFHLLDPWCEAMDGRPTNWLEEGLATWYQNEIVPAVKCHVGKYAKAEDLVGPLMADLPDAVKRIRQECALRIGEIPSDILRSHCPAMSEETARKLCQRFEY